MTTITGPTVGESLRYCVACNYPMVAEQIATMKHSELCPNCHTAFVGLFYWPNSTEHRKHLAHYSKLEATGFSSVPTKLLNVLQPPPELSKQEDPTYE